MANAEEFSKNYLVVDAKKASLFDIACILICSTKFLNNKSFYNELSQDAERIIVEIFWQRWLIFASVLAQKLLIWAKEPMAWIGSLIETWLNLLSSNGGFFGLVINSIQGKVVQLEESSEKFMSFLGELDTRLQLDESIKKGDGRYNRSLAMMAAKLSYENEAFVKVAIKDHLKMEYIGFYKFWNDYQNQFTTYATMFQDTSDPNLIVVAFRGTGPFNTNDWITDVDISWYELKDTNTSKPIGRIHSGFMKALGLQKIKGWPKELENPTDEHPFAYYTIREKLKNILEKNENAKFILTGHSLGAALAILFVGVLGLHEETWLLKRLEGVYTFGQPRVGDEWFGKYMMKMIEDHGLRYFRYVYCNDIVPRLPYDDRALFFKHFGQSLYFDSFYNGKVLEEEPNKNYFSLVWVIPKYINALWEIIRGFILPYWKGKEYREVPTEKLFRLVGLVIPGLAAHGCKDYIDVTRLGTDLVPTIVNMKIKNN
ncbi:alpha/beta-Hydrolases superfamily protein [Artemisia annua]|uniref:Alpha/beta-Hydrolases superfamily protein n=1 Tax=Artemisia annua TaxID=35608 RepID=A0A2U1LZS1_ARTAN|nr:alpha/beta-Hydrolases superfamily protein [Artemisia annua]